MLLWCLCDCSSSVSIVPRNHGASANLAPVQLWRQCNPDTGELQYGTSAFLLAHYTRASWGRCHPSLRIPAPDRGEPSRHLVPAISGGGGGGVSILSPLMADLSGLWGSSMRVMHGRPQGLFSRCCIIVVRPLILLVWHWRSTMCWCI